MVETAVARNTSVGMNEVRKDGFAALWEAASRAFSFDGLRRTPPMWREARMWSELAIFQLDPIARGVGLPAGDGRPVFLIPGYMAGDFSLAPMARALVAAGFDAETSGLHLNVGCAGKMITSIETRLEAHVAKAGKKALLVGQSRGGVLARWLASRRPDLVGGLVTLGTPLLDQLALHPAVLMNIGLVTTLGAVGVPGFLSGDCLKIDRCCEAMFREIDLPLARDVSFLSVYSRSDGIVDWQACLDPAARHLEVASSHCGMAFHVDVMRAIGAELATEVE